MFAAFHFGVHIFPETWAEGVYEGPPCLHPYAGGGGKRGPAKISDPGLRSGHESDGDRQVLKEGRQGGLSTMTAMVDCIVYFDVLLIVTLTETMYPGFPRFQCIP